MQSFDNAQAIANAPRLMTDPQLQNLLADRVQDWTALGLLGLTHLVLVEVGDTEESIVDVIGSSPLINSLDGKRFGAAEFVLPFDILSDHGGYFELVMTIGNDGYARVIFVHNREGVDTELLAMCRAYAGH